MLVRGDRLSPTARAEVLRAFVHRNTTDHPSPYGAVQLGPNGPGSDADWLAARAFHVVRDGSRLSRTHRDCEPAFMADPDPAVCPDRAPLRGLHRRASR